MLVVLYEGHIVGSEEGSGFADRWEGGMKSSLGVVARAGCVIVTWNNDITAGGGGDGGEFIAEVFLALK